MQALKCNRCEKCFDPNTMIGAMIRFRNPVVKDAEDFRTARCQFMFPEFMADEFIDLCPDCAKGFRYFMSGEDADADIIDRLTEQLHKYEKMLYFKDSSLKPEDM